MSRTPDQYALARKLLASEAAALVSDDWGATPTRTDIVPRPARGRAVPLPLPDADDETLRMSPERVLALLKAEITVPEPLEPTPGHTPTRVFDPAEVSSSQKESAEPPASQAKPSSQGKVSPDTSSSPRAKSSPENRQPFEVMESLPARPPRAPNLPSELSSAAAGAAPRPRRRAVKGRLKRISTLVAMAVAVFMTTFLLTKGLRDEAARVRAWEFISGFGARLGSWFSSQAEPPQPKTSATVLSLRADAKSAPAPAATSPRRISPRATEPSTPVVRLEDLTVLQDCSGPDCASPEIKSASKQRRAVRTRSR